MPPLNEHMSIQPCRPLLDSLRDVLRKMEADAESDTSSLAELKRILRERIATIEALNVSRLVTCLGCTAKSPLIQPI